MSLALLGLTAGFILVVAFLYYLLIRTELNIFIKFLAAIVTAGFYIIQFESLQQYTGWPSTDELPEKFVLIASDVREPDQKTGEEGVMYWWIRDSANLQQPPRVYELPYAAETHKKSEQVLEEQKKGSQYVGRKSEYSPASAGTGISFERISKTERHQKTKPVASTAQ